MGLEQTQRHFSVLPEEKTTPAKVNDITAKIAAATAIVEERARINAITSLEGAFIKSLEQMTPEARKRIMDRMKDLDGYSEN